MIEYVCDRCFENIGENPNGYTDAGNPIWPSEDAHILCDLCAEEWEKVRKEPGYLEKPSERNCQRIIKVPNPKAIDEFRQWLHEPLKN